MASMDPHLYSPGTSLNNGFDSDSVEDWIQRVRADTVIAARNAALADAHATNPKRFAKQPTEPKLPEEAWINDPSRETLIKHS